MADDMADRNDPELKYLSVERNLFNDPAMQAEWTEKRIESLTKKLTRALDVVDSRLASMSPQTVIKLDPKEALSGIFSQITSGDETMREKCFKFLPIKLSNLGSEVITKDVEDFLIERVKNVFQDVTAEEFHLYMTILSSTKLSTTITGHVN